jgi:photosynthetic reaction center H subunit
MQTGALTEYLDVAQVVLYAFWAFFLLLILYIRQEDRREGYPLEHDLTGKVGPAMWPFLPDPKTFILPHGRGVVQAPNLKRDTRMPHAKKFENYPGSPLEPTGDPIRDQVGPGSYTERMDVPDLTSHGDIKIVPIAKSHGYALHPEDPDPRGMPVFGVDGREAGKITEVWVDQSEHMARYMELQLASGGGTVLVPVNFTVMYTKPNRVFVNALTSAQIANVPRTKAADSITLLEEDKISGYFGGGMLYAHPKRSEPIL